MRRDYFTFDVRDADAEESGMPTVRIDFEGPGDEFTDRLTDEQGEPLTAGEVDVAYRLVGPAEEDGPSGVVAVTNRVTGEFILELNAPAEGVFAFVAAARRYGKDADDEHRYRIELTVDGEHVVTHEKGTLLVYDSEGELLRQHSLIPGGVEL